MPKTAIPRRRCKARPWSRVGVIRTRQPGSWLNDPRLEKLVSGNTFDLAEIATGELDLFVTYPSADGEALAPFLRWLLMDIFSVAREKEIAERIIIFADEAANLGRFDELISAASELPGRGVSLWTFWQDRNQIVELYGEAAAHTLENLAEIMTFSDLPASDPGQLEHFSRALGNYTAFVESNSEDETKASTTRSIQAVQLMTPTALRDLSSRKLIALSNSKSRAKHPMLLDKTVWFEDRRFTRFLRNIRPVA